MSHSYFQFGISEFLLLTPSDMTVDAVLTENQKNLVISSLHIASLDTDWFVACSS